MVNSYHLTVEDKIIQHLRANPSSMRLLETKIDASYHTIRTVMYDLVDRNIVVLDGFKYRHQIFALNPDKDQMSTIPYLNDTKGQSQKAYSLLRSVGNESRMKGAQSIKDLPKHMTALFMLALKYKNSKTRNPADPELGELRERMQADLVQIESIANLYRQILAHPKFWNELTLKDMASDKDFDHEEVLAANSYYEQMDADAPQFQSPLE